MFAVEGLDVQDDEVSCWNRLKIICRDAGIDGLRVGQRVIVLTVVKADVSGVAAYLVHQIALVLRAALGKGCELHIDVST